MEILELMGVPYFKKGKGIHIKKKNRGKFTEYCNGKVTKECIDKAKKSNNPTLRKRAVFAENARKWKHREGGVIKAQEGTSIPFLQKLGKIIQESGTAARDARVGAIGAQQVRDLYTEGKNQEAQDLAKQYAKANTTGIAMAGGAASTSLLGDLFVTGTTTAVDTAIDGNASNFGKNFLFNASADLLGRGVGKLIGKAANRAKTKVKTSFFKDAYGREITPTPYPGPDSDLVKAVEDSQLSVLRDYFSEGKINQIKKTMNWGDAEIDELQDEIIRSMGVKTDVSIKGPEDGFTIIGQHHGEVRGTGNNSTGVHYVTLNRERIPNLQKAEEVGIHEIGGHGKTLSMQAEDFGKGGYSDQMKEMFPRLAQITQKNSEMANEILKFNRLGQYFDKIRTVQDLERYFDANNIPWDRWDKFNNQRKYFNYATKADEKTIRAYTGQLFEKLHGPEVKTNNIESLERYFTPESVERFKQAVLGVSPLFILNEVSTNVNKNEQ